MQTEILCVACANFCPLAPHEDAISLPAELNRGLCAVHSDGVRMVFFGDQTCKNAVPAYRERSFTDVRKFLHPGAKNRGKA